MEKKEISIYEQWFNDYRIDFIPKGNENQIHLGLKRKEDSIDKILDLLVYGDYLNEMSIRSSASMHSSYFGCFAQQLPNAFTEINKLLIAFDIKNIIEIGTLDGGLSTFLALYSFNSKHSVSGVRTYLHHKNNKNFHTFDVKNNNPKAIELIETLGGHFHEEDCFKQESKIAKLIQQEGKTLILCDGGNKKKEINTFSKYLKFGDIIMGHDYFRSTKEKELYLFTEDRGHGLENLARWRSDELCYEDVEDVFEQEGIESICRDNFDPVVWLCGLKIGKD